MAILRLTSCLLLAALAVQDPIKTSFSELAGFTYKEGMKLPAEVTKLDEKVVTIQGFMKREFPGSGPVNQFLLVNDAGGCNGTPMLHEIVFCMLPDGVKKDIKPGVVKVTGKLYVGEEKEDGVVIMLYQMDADTVQ
ncbi:MAG: DUF3299 domain-containing protein [Planctomycetes bacterium]|nr:DUF3299 domain-containing protein [Planctomycetota bacterium]